VSPSSIPDQELVARARQRDEAAFGELLQRYRQPIFRFVWRLLDNAADADEVAQETFVRAWQHLAEFDPRQKFSTWLFALARNAAIDRLRWRKRHPTETLAPDAPLPAATSVTAEVQNRELSDQIAAAVQALPEDQRTALVLAEYEGLSHAEIGAVMHCSAKSVESRLYRARQFLRGRLERWMA
jgi:RNA polymerase sigma-70 factor (ECF subfamily)